MYFYRNLYASPMLKKHKNKIKWKLRIGKPQPFVYIIALTHNNDLMEIYHSSILKQKHFKKKENRPFIIGVACGYEAAVTLVTEIIMDVYNETGNYDVKSFIRSKTKNKGQVC